MTDQVGRGASAALRVALAAVATAASVGMAAAQGQPGGRLDARGMTLSGAYLSARYAIAHNDAERGADFLNAALNRDAANVQILRLTHSLMLSAGRFDQAVTLAKRLHTFDPSDQLALTTLVMDEVRGERFDSAADYLAQMTLDGPARLLVPIMQSWVQVGQGDAEGALATLDTLAGVPGVGPLVAFNRGLMQEQAGDQAGARATFDGIAEGALSLRMADLIGAFYQRAGDADAARGVYQRYLEGQPGDTVIGAALDRLEAGEPAPDAIARPAQGMAEALFQFSAAFNQQDNPEIGLIYAGYVGQLAPDFALGTILLGDLLAGQSRHADAEAAYRRVPADAPEAWMARLRLAEQLDALGQHDDAIGLLTGMAEERPDDPSPLMLIGDIRRDSERFHDAILAYDEAGEREEGAGQGWLFFYKRGIALERARQWDRAVADLERAVELNPEHAHVLNYLGYIWADRGENMEVAENLIRRAVAMAPRDGYIVDSLGWVLYRTGRYDAAVEQLERAVELQPEDPVLNDHLGDAYWMVGRRTEARYQWERAARQATDQDEEPELLAAITEKLNNGLPPPELAGGVPDKVTPKP